jgi:hypothetical protein
MRVAVHQPHYAPWRPYLEKWRAADVFIVLDTVQYERGGWQNRCTLPDGRWLSVPVHAPLGTRLDQVTVCGDTWRRKHAAALPEWRDLVYHRRWYSLVPLALTTMVLLAARHGITTPLRVASLLDVDATDPTDRLIALVKAVGGDTYLSGPHGPHYMDMDAFERCGIAVEVRDFSAGLPTWTAAR